MVVYGGRGQIDESTANSSSFSIGGDSTAVHALSSGTISYLAYLCSISYIFVILYSYYDTFDVHTITDCAGIDEISGATRTHFFDFLLLLPLFTLQFLHDNMC
jgi:hypothetical protein